MIIWLVAQPERAKVVVISLASSQLSSSGLQKVSLQWAACSLAEAVVLLRAAS